jgi:L-aspartate oxidase
MPGLFVVGEAACTGVHGANRLASNSLTEGIVAGTRVGRDLAWELPAHVAEDALEQPVAAGLLAPELRGRVRAAMSRNVGVLRSPEGLAVAADTIADLAATISTATAPSRRAFEATNLITVATAMVTAARARSESRGCHRRSDYTEPRTVWLTHLNERLDAHGSITVSGRPEGA